MSSPSAAAGPSVVVIEGLIAGGKSTLLQRLAEHYRGRGLKVCTVPEPVQRWVECGMLELFYSNPGAYAYQFQTLVYCTRIQAIREAVAACPCADVYLLERCPESDRMFMEMLRSAVSAPVYQAYLTWCDTHDLLLPFDLARAAFVYLSPSTGECMRRLAVRARAGEVDADGAPGDASAPDAGTGVSLEYQAQLARAHEARFFGRHSAEFPELARRFDPARRFVEIPSALADRNFRDDTDAARDLVRTIAEIIDRARGGNADAPDPATPPDGRAREWKPLPPYGAAAKY